MGWRRLFELRLNVGERFCSMARRKLQIEPPAHDIFHRCCVRDLHCVDELHGEHSRRKKTPGFGSIEISAGEFSDPRYSAIQSAELRCLREVVPSRDLGL